MNEGEETYLIEVHHLSTRYKWNYNLKNISYYTSFKHIDNLYLYMKTIYIDKNDIFYIFNYTIEDYVSST